VADRMKARLDRFRGRSGDSDEHDAGSGGEAPPVAEADKPRLAGS